MAASVVAFTYMTVLGPMTGGSLSPESVLCLWSAGVCWGLLATFAGLSLALEQNVGPESLQSKDNVPSPEDPARDIDAKLPNHNP